MLSLRPVRQIIFDNQSFVSGKLILIDKPKGWTSFRVVNRIHHLTRVKTGHAGTLDPLATGLLICCTGVLTKSIQRYQSMVKEYTGTIVLGAHTPTFDLESQPIPQGDPSQIPDEKLQEGLKAFLGPQLQVPPIHSAIKQNGKPVYRLARKGREVVLSPRPIEIYELEGRRVQTDQMEFRVVCSTGTYIRSLTQDLGQWLGCGAYLGSLCRTRIGDYSLDQAQTLEQFESSLGQFGKEDQKG